MTAPHLQHLQEKRLRLLDRLLPQGTLRLILPHGTIITIGSGLPCATMRLKKKGALWRMLYRPSLSIGELYTNGAWEAEDGELLTVLRLLMSLRIRQSSWPVWSSLWLWLYALLHENNVLQRSRSRARAHYNNDINLFRAFLDENLHYSCAYFREPGLSLQAAQEAKADHISRKLCVSPKAHVLDIGSGWGAMALHLARHHDVQVTGLNVSDEQNRYAANKAQELGLADRVRFLTEDYRSHQGSYDAIVSIGMFEHVGRPWYRRYFETIARLLKPDGIALVHTIGRSSPPGGTNPWIRRHIFPGGYIPALSEISAAVQTSGLAILDVEVWRLHYAMTIQQWRTSFESNWDYLAARCGEAFCRMWRFYLTASEASFRWDNLVVFQVQLGFASTTRCPLTRDYLYLGDHQASKDGIQPRVEAFQQGNSALQERAMEPFAQMRP